MNNNLLNIDVASLLNQSRLNSLCLTNDAIVFLNTIIVDIMTHLSRVAKNHDKREKYISYKSVKHAIKMLFVGHLEKFGDIQGKMNIKTSTSIIPLDFIRKHLQSGSKRKATDEALLYLSGAIEYFISNLIELCGFENTHVNLKDIVESINKDTYFRIFAEMLHFNKYY